MEGYDKTLSDFESAIIDYETLTQDFATGLGPTTNYDAMLSIKPPNPHSYSFNSIMDSATDEQDNWHCYLVDFGIDCHVSSLSISSGILPHCFAIVCSSSKLIASLNERSPCRTSPRSWIP